MPTYPDQKTETKSINDNRIVHSISEILLLRQGWIVFAKNTYKKNGHTLTLTPQGYMLDGSAVSFMEDINI